MDEAVREREGIFADFLQDRLDPAGSVVGNQVEIAPVAFLQGVAGQNCLPQGCRVFPC